MSFLFNISYFPHAEGRRSRPLEAWGIGISYRKLALDLGRCDGAVKPSVPAVAGAALHMPHVSARR